MHEKNFGINRRKYKSKDYTKLKNFSTTDCIQKINASFLGLTKNCVNPSWKYLWPQIVRRERKISPISKEIGKIFDSAHKITGENFSAMKEHTLNKIIKSHDTGLTEENLIQIVESKNLETDNEHEKHNQKYFFPPLILTVSVSYPLFFLLLSKSFKIFILDKKKKKIKL